VRWFRTVYYCSCQGCFAGCAYKVGEWQWPSCSDPTRMTPPHIAHSLNKCLNKCEDHSLLAFTSTVQCMKYFIYNFNMLAESCELLNWEKMLTYMHYHLSMNFIAWECNKAAWKLQSTWVDFMHNWFWYENIFISTCMNKKLMVIKIIQGYPVQQ